MSFNLCIHPCSQHHSLDNRTFLPAIFQSHLPVPTAESIMIYFIRERSCLFLNSIHMQLKSVYPFCLAFFIQNEVGVIYPYHCMYHQFQHLYCSAVFHCMNILQFIHFPVDKYLECFQAFKIYYESSLSILFF